MRASTARPLRNSDTVTALTQPRRCPIRPDDTGHSWPADAAATGADSRRETLGVSIRGPAHRRRVRTSRAGRSPTAPRPRSTPRSRSARWPTPGSTLADVDAYFCSGDAPGFGPLSMAEYLGLTGLSYVDSTEIGGSLVRRPGRPRRRGHRRRQVLGGAHHAGRQAPHRRRAPGRRRPHAAPRPSSASRRCTARRSSPTTPWPRPVTCTSSAPRASSWPRSRSRPAPTPSTTRTPSSATSSPSRRCSSRRWCAIRSTASTAA